MRLSYMRPGQANRVAPSIGTKLRVKHSWIALEGSLHRCGRGRAIAKCGLESTVEKRLAQAPSTPFLSSFRTKQRRPEKEGARLPLATWIWELCRDGPFGERELLALGEIQVARLRTRHDNKQPEPGAASGLAIFTTNLSLATGRFSVTVTLFFPPKILSRTVR